MFLISFVVVRSEAEAPAAEVHGITPEMSDAEYLAAVRLADKEPLLSELDGDGIKSNTQYLDWVDRQLQLTEVESLRFRSGLFQLTGDPRTKVHARRSPALYSFV